MARQKAPDPPEDDVPAWVMTFSDVITLLMTFFILLLTFATNQPETFDRMQVAMFGGGGADGFAGSVEGMDKDDLQMRERARTGRMSPDGTKTPPIYSDPAMATLDKGMAGLELEEYRVIATMHHIRQPMPELVDAEGRITTRGKQRLALLGRQLRKRPLRVEFMVNSEADLPYAVKLVEYLTNSQGIVSSSLGVGIASHLVNNGEVLIVVSNQGANRGPKD